MYLGTGPGFENYLGGVGKSQATWSTVVITDWPAFFADPYTFRGKLMAFILKTSVFHQNPLGFVQIARTIIYLYVALLSLGILHVLTIEAPRPW